MSTISVVLQAPSGVAAGSVVIGRSGASYTVGATGYVTITNSDDLGPLLTAGFLVAKPWSGRASEANGIAPTPLPLSGAKNPTGAALAAAAAAGVFGYAVTLGTSYGLLSEAANNGTKTDNAMFEYVLPDDYVPGANFNVAVDTTITIGGGTLSVKTIQAKGYPITQAGVMSADIGPGSATAIAANAATVTNFTMTGTGLVPGQRVMIEVTLVLTETASSNVTATVNSVTVS